MKTLKIDNGFKDLIRPLFKAEYLQLEANLLADGCRHPIITWHDTIIDGHNRYEICTKHHIPFETEEIDFTCREEAVAWICANQLGRRNLTDESRKYLIGKQYEAEKVVATKRNALGINQYRITSKATAVNNDADSPSKRSTALKIAEENHISHGTVEKYAAYSKALDDIGKKEPNLVPKILSGKYKISHNSVVDLSKRDTAEIRRINKRLEHSERPFAQYQTTRSEIYRNAVPCPSNTPSVKDMPRYDPDAELTSLAMTVPSWISSIERIKKSSDLANTSFEVRHKVKKVMLALQQSASEMLRTLEEELL